jgi:ABC-type Na+ efflux pump permease subunit
MAIMIILGIILISIIICFIKDYFEDKYDIDKANEIMTFIVFFPIVILMIYLAFKSIGI